MIHRVRSLGLGYVLRFAARLTVVAVRHPREAIDHLQTQIALSRAGSSITSPTPIERDPEWRGALHDQFGIEGPCDRCSQFAAVWTDLASELTASPAGLGHDADADLAEAIWAIVAHTEPTTIVETGVSRGITSRIVLTALERFAPAGRLVSVDLPPLEEPWRRLVGSAVPLELQGRWTYLRGSSSRLLPGVVRDVGQINLFIHDSLHTPEYLLTELAVAWPRLAPGAFVVIDDAELCDAGAVVASLTSEPLLGVTERAKRSVAVIVRHDGSAASATHA
jgi:Methyltransferase domain